MAKHDLAQAAPVVLEVQAPGLSDLSMERWSSMTYDGFKFDPDAFDDLIDPGTVIPAADLNPPPGADMTWEPPSGLTLLQWLSFQPCPYCNRPGRALCEQRCPQYPVWVDSNGKPLASPSVLAQYQRDSQP